MAHADLAKTTANVLLRQLRTAIITKHFPSCRINIYFFIIRKRFCLGDVEGAVFRVSCPWPSAGLGFRGSLGSFMAVAPSSLPLRSLGAASKEAGTAAAARLLQSAGPKRGAHISGPFLAQEGGHIL